MKSVFPRQLIQNNTRCFVVWYLTFFFFFINSINVAPERILIHVCPWHSVHCFLCVCVYVTIYLRFKISLNMITCKLSCKWTHNNFFRHMCFHDEFILFLFYFVLCDERSELFILPNTIPISYTRSFRDFFIYF